MHSTYVLVLAAIALIFHTLLLLQSHKRTIYGSFLLVCGPYKLCASPHGSWGCCCVLDMSLHHGECTALMTELSRCSFPRGSVFIITHTVLNELQAYGLRQGRRGALATRRPVGQLGQDAAARRPLAGDKFGPAVFEGRRNASGWLDDK